MKRLARGLRAALGMALLTGGLLEVSLRAAAGLGLYQTIERPTEPTGFYREPHPDHGIWHLPEAVYTARTSCYTVTYRSNAWGARDRERSLAGDGARVAVLGDSFVEGLGVASGSRMTDRLEELSGVPHLNFGTAGYFSSVHEWLLYEDLVSRFHHDLVLLFTLPDNDFTDNDPEHYTNAGRYRAYLRETDGGFEVFHPVAFDDAERRARRELRWNRVYNALYLYRFGAWLELRLRALLAGERPFPGRGHVGYVSWSELDLERLFFSYRKLRDAAGGREVAVFTIPRLADLLHRREGGATGRLAERLAAFAAGEPRIRYADLLPGFAAHAERNGRDYADYFLPCDGHWSELGSAVAAELVLAELADVAPYAARPAQGP